MDTYSHVLPSIQRDAVDALDGFFAPVAVNVAVNAGDE